MRRQPNDLVIVSILAVLCAAITLVAAALPVLRVAGALPLVLFLPGYALAACLPHQTFDRAVRLALSLGLSVSITILLGLVLYWLGINLQTITWAGALAVTTLIACGIAWRRRRATGEEGSTLHLSVNLGWRDAILLGAAVMIGVAAISIARLPAPADNVLGYTSLWMIPARDGDPRNYELGIVSQEFNTVTYHLQVIADGRVVQDWPELELAPGKTWTGSMALPADRLTTGSIEAALYRLDNPGVVYRQVKLQRDG